MKVRIPRILSGPERKALEKCIARGAADARITEERFAIAMAGFLECMADLVSMGQVVPLYNVAKVGASLEERKARCARYNNGFPFCVPRFVSGKPFRMQVKATAPASRAAKEALDNFARNATRRAPGEEQLRVFDDMQRIRDAIATQMRED